MIDSQKQYALWDEFLAVWPAPRLATMTLEDGGPAWSDWLVKAAARTDDSRLANYAAKALLHLEAAKGALGRWLGRLGWILGLM